MPMKGKHTINYLQYHEYGFGRPSLEREVQLVFVFIAPVAELNVVSFTVPLNGSTIVATATVVTSCSSSTDCPYSAAPMCCGGVYVAMLCGVEVSLVMVITISFGTVWG